MTGKGVCFVASSAHDVFTIWERLTIQFQNFEHLRKDDDSILSGSIFSLHDPPMYLRRLRPYDEPGFRYWCVKTHVVFNTLGLHV